MSAVKSNECSALLCTFQQSVKDGVGKKYACRKDAHWTIWNSHCEEFGIVLFLKCYNNPVPHLASFSERYKSRAITSKGKPVIADYVSDIFCFIGRVFSSVVALDPRMSTINGKIDFRLRQQKGSWKQGDDPPRQVKPCPVTIITYSRLPLPVPSISPPRRIFGRVMLLLNHVLIISSIVPSRLLSE